MYTTHYSNPGSLVGIDTGIIGSAKKTLDMAAYALVDTDIVQAILAAAQHGVSIRLYLDRTELEAEARGNPQRSNSPLGPLLSTANVQTKVQESSILMHLKSYGVDGKVLRDGSANFSPLGESEQDNSMLLTDDGPTVALFQSKFEAMWNRPDNISVAQAVASPQRMNSTAHRAH
jgi:phosphatidylserine/phosphatidylglycerophosphate/cardiolipin synthase-like enzyme